MGPHCYAYAVTYNITNAQGATTKILVVQLHCGQCGGGNTTPGFIDDEMWFGNPTYWVEAGYSTGSNLVSSWQYYFWADHRPVDCSSCVNEHPLSNVPSGDYNQYATFTIKRTSSTSFHTTISSPNYSASGDSTNNTMGVSIVTMGQELAGNAGASAPNARFIYRYYWNSSGTSVGIGSNYSPHQDSPPFFNVILGSGPSDFYTHCC